MDIKGEARWLATRASYDAIALEYANRIYDELKDKPFDRAFLDCFAERVRTLGRVCEFGCGPGQVARYLADYGVSVFGLDISPEMIREARRLNPHIEFVEGTMSSLQSDPGSLGGIAAFYSIIHLRRDEVPAAFGQMRRVLRPGGVVAIAFHLGSDVIHTAELWGYSVQLDATLFEVTEMVGYLEAAGFTVEQAQEREPYPDVEYQSRRGYVMATKPRQ